MIDKIKNITILGSTGSIGVQTLEVISSKPEYYNVNYLTANSNIDLLAKQIIKYKPKGVVVKNKELCNKLKTLISEKLQIKCGKEALIEAASDESNDLVVSALVGFSGVLPTLSAIENGITIALANKETLVSAGSIITESAKRNNVSIIAVDSEHSAILQCLAGESNSEIEKLILTASGGPFYTYPIDKFKNLKVAQALAHPNWSMGSKITIDSATLMNKGFEVIEAKWLFNVKKENIEVLIHPQSIVHSLVQFVDGSVKAQLGLPDMKIPISYALSYPKRLQFNFPRLDLAAIGKLEFIEPDFDKFPCLRIAYNCLEAGGTSTVVLNAANEIAVSAFLKEKILFNQIPILIEEALNNIQNIEKPSLNNIIEIDEQTRIFTNELLSKSN